MKLMKHQEDFLKKNLTKCILYWEMRCGKSLPSSIWISQRSGDRYIICPKQVKKDWEAFETGATVLSKEEFKKVASTLRPTAIVVDEAHYFASTLFKKGRSKMAEAMYMLVKRNPQMDVLLLTATPVRQDAWSLHTLLCYIGVYYDWKVWQREFFEKKAMPWLPRQPWMRAGQMPEAWAPKADWRERLKPYLAKHTDIVCLRDIVEYLPPAESVVVRIKRKELYVEPEDEIVTWVHEHQWEQANKAEEILKLGYRKLIVVCHYTSQIDSLAASLGEDGRAVYVLDGRTKDASAVKKAAQEAEECYFLVQSSMGFGFDGYMFGATVFASMSHSNVNHIQMLGRARHVAHLQPVQYVYLIGGRWDKRIYDTVIEGRDFNANEWLST